MCECNLIVDTITAQPIDIPDEPHQFIYIRHGKEFVLLDGFRMGGKIEYAAVHEIKDMYGVKTGYMFVVGERDGSAVETVSVEAGGEDGLNFGVSPRDEDTNPEASRLRKALEAIAKAPGGGPGKRIAIQALEGCGNRETNP
jgi:hypothetical protein